MHLSPAGSRPWGLCTAAGPGGALGGVGGPLGPRAAGGRALDRWGARQGVPAADTRGLLPLLGLAGAAARPCRALLGAVGGGSRWPGAGGPPCGGDPPAGGGGVGGPGAWAGRGHSPADIHIRVVERRSYDKA
jgi:hypothetical protein